MENKESWNIAKLISWMTSYFRERDVDAPRLTSELLLSHLLGKDRVYLYTNFDQPLSQDELTKLREYVKRRAAYEPVAYITGEKSFFKFEFKVDKEVLIPRPDTEILLDAALVWLKKKKDSRVLELGTGSGILAVSIAATVDDAKVFATDISLASLKLARANASFIAGEKKVNFILADWFSGLKPGFKFDLIVSNPPYIKTDAIKGLQQEVQKYEPMRALDGGSDGLDSYRKIISNAASHLKSDGRIMMEIGYDQAEDLERLCSAEDSLELIEILKDYGGRDRVVVIGKNS